MKFGRDYRQNRLWRKRLHGRSMPCFAPTPLRPAMQWPAQPRQRVVDHIVREPGPPPTIASLKRRLGGSRTQSVAAETSPGNARQMCTASNNKHQDLTGLLAHFAGQSQVSYRDINSPPSTDRIKDKALVFPSYSARKPGGCMVSNWEAIHLHV